MELKVDITDEALITALNAVGEIVVKNASESLLGTSLRAKEAGYTILRNGEEVNPGETKKQRGEKKNGDVGEAVAMEAIGKWKAFKKNRDSNSVTVKDYESFYSEYKEFYKNKVESLLSEEFISERELMQEIFGILYEDAGDEKPDADLETSGGGGDDDEESEEDDNDESSGGGSDGGEGDVSDGIDKNEDQITNIFIVPMKGLDVDMDKSRF